MARRRTKSLAAASVQLAALAVAAVGLAGLAGSVNATLDAVNHFAPLWTSAAMALALASLALGRPARARALTAAMTAVAAGLIVMGPEVIAAARAKASPAAPADEVIRIVQFNAWGGRGHDPVQAAAWISAQQADFVIVQESDDLTPALTASLLKVYPYKANCALPSRCPVMILSRRPALMAQGFFHPGKPQPLTLGRYAGRKGPIELLAVHMAWPLPAGPQAYHRNGLAEVAAGLDRNSLIIAGDFNSTPWSFSLRRLDRRLGMARRTLALASWPAGKFSRRLPPAPFPMMPIDQLYAGQDWRTVSVARGPYVGSDHYPVVTVLAR